MVRNTLTPRIRWFTSSANSSPSAACTGTTTRANPNVLSSDRMNVGSWVNARV